MFLLGYIGAPPTITVISAQTGATAKRRGERKAGGEADGAEGDLGVHIRLRFLVARTFGVPPVVSGCQGNGGGKAKVSGDAA